MPLKKSIHPLARRRKGRDIIPGLLISASKRTREPHNFRSSPGEGKKARLSRRRHIICSGRDGKFGVRGWLRCSYWIFIFRRNLRAVWAMVTQSSVWLPGEYRPKGWILVRAFFFSRTLSFSRGYCGIILSLGYKLL